MLTLTAPGGVSEPGRRNFATRNCPLETSFQPEGTCHFGLPSSDPGAETGGACKAEVLTGGREGGRSVFALVGAKLNDFKKSTNAAFCSLTRESSPVILKNQAMPFRIWIAPRIRVGSSELGGFPACSNNLAGWAAIWTGWGSCASFDS